MKITITAECDSEVELADLALALAPLALERRASGQVAQALRIATTPVPPTERPVAAQVAPETAGPTDVGRTNTGQQTAAEPAFPDELDMAYSKAKNLRQLIKAICAAKPQLAEKGVLEFCQRLRANKVPTVLDPISDADLADRVHSACEALAEGG